ncbi:hypothetical protein [Nocardioides pyridinolyticus]
MDSVCWSQFRSKYATNQLHLYRSQHGVAYFSANADQRAAGARWYSCHAIVVSVGALAQLPHPLPRLSSKLPDSVASCLTSGSVHTICAAAHSYRSTYAFYGSGTSSEATFRAAAQRTCPRYVSSKKWYYTWLDLPGTKFILGCFTKTTR